MSNYACRFCGNVATKEPCEHCGKHDREFDNRVICMAFVAGTCTSKIHCAGMHPHKAEIACRYPGKCEYNSTGKLIWCEPVKEEK